MFPHGETVTRLRATLITDPYSGEDTEPDWEFPTESPIPGCGVADGGSVEPLEQARNAVDSDFVVYMPTGTDVRSTDRLRIRGLVCEVAGRPFDWIQPQTGWRPENSLVVHASVREG